MASLLKKILTVFALILTAALGFYLYTHMGESLETTDMALAENAAAETAEFLERLQELTDIEINGEIFSDERFSSLNNFSTPVQTELIGQANPFSVN